MPTSFIDDAEYWRKRAEEARTISEHMTDAHTKALMLSVAESYERIAKWAAQKTGEYIKGSASYQSRSAQ